MATLVEGLRTNVGITEGNFSVKLCAVFNALVDRNDPVSPAKQTSSATKYRQGVECADRLSLSLTKKKVVARKVRFHCAMHHHQSG